MSAVFPHQTCFWMVWRYDGPSSNYKHPTQVSAENEARRLARETPGSLFIVTQSLTGYMVPAPGVQKIDYDPIPF